MGNHEIHINMTDKEKLDLIAEYGVSMASTMIRKTMQFIPEHQNLKKYGIDYAELELRVLSEREQKQLK